MIKKGNRYIQFLANDNLYKLLKEFSEKTNLPISYIVNNLVSFYLPIEVDKFVNKFKEEKKCVEDVEVE